MSPNPRPITETQIKIVKPFVKWLSIFNAWIYQWSNGRWLGRYGGGDICVVKMTGAKSGQPRELPLMYVPYKDGLILVASFAGGPHHPTWYYNLIAHPDIEVSLRGKQLLLVARRASAEEKAAVWPLCVQHYRDYDLYQRRTTRDIPVFICAPRPVIASAAQQSS